MMSEDEIVKLELENDVTWWLYDFMKTVGRAAKHQKIFMEKFDEAYKKRYKNTKESRLNYILEQEIMIMQSIFLIC